MERGRLPSATSTCSKSVFQPVLVTRRPHLNPLIWLKADSIEMSFLMYHTEKF